MQQDITLLDGFWDRVDDEMHRQNKSKRLVAERCRFERKTLYRSKQNNRYIRVVYFARLCVELNVSADIYCLEKERKVYKEWLYQVIYG